ncbi:MAG: NUDIX hydrolase [Acidithiobacillus sp.]|nr:NUDIX hydrolase [Acidithiobacillus sp.]
MRWRPDVTVAAVVTNESGAFLLVEELIDGQACLNQPAGHWEPHETLLEAVARETREETGYGFAPTALVGIYHWRHPHKDLTYLRFAFTGNITDHDPTLPLDAGIIGPRWVHPDKLHSHPLRSTMVQNCIADYLQGQRAPLTLIRHLVPEQNGSPGSCW